MRPIDMLVVHCSATGTEDITAATIREWHLAKGWQDIGYHYVIRRDGTVEKGREDAIAGAHAEGFNTRSIGICLIGGVNADHRDKAEFNYTRLQLSVLQRLLLTLTMRYPEAKVLGHRDLPNVAKECPCFNVRAWWYNEGAPSPHSPHHSQGGSIA